ncbi:conserved hypothetical protein [Culex quinquefasciatus]|uniref:Uncharacterized protein n=1 Tax=Culex quinquefasciatus TaxID=7176 RepID=B0W4A8_CULQU|nr:conserved hypothetical protein [Culex quinquefasciatus]|eukprot:XP_001843550.1 conserved hypothetical protein [Culex quinquefasciatus]
MHHPHRTVVHAVRPRVKAARGSNNPQNAAAARSLAQEIQSKPGDNKGALKVLREQLLQSTHHKQDEMVQMVRDSQMHNALHEAIDEKIVDQSFIRTLASVGEPPLIKDYTRDMLLVNTIKEDVNFTFGENVFAWKTLEHKNKDHHVIVGFSREKIVILYEHFGEYSLEQEIAMVTVPTAFEVITVWDSTDDTAVSCLVVATEQILVWYTMRSKTNFALTEEWRWPVYKTTTLIKHIRQKDTDMLLMVGTHPNAQQSVSATLYEFNFERQQFWLMQMLDLDFPCRSIGVVNDGNEYLVAIPQNDTARIYSLKTGQKYRGKFDLIANFTSEDVNAVGAFQIGRYLYIAIGGKTPQILRYINGNFTSQNIPAEAFETVEAFFVIPTRTYRDDMILLVQHKMTFSTHELQRLEILVWNGESFDIRSNIPCYVENDITGNEVSCMLDLYRASGIVGSTIIQRGNQVSMIIPRYQAHSSLFHLNVGMLSGSHPITQKIQEMHDTIDAFTKIIQNQDSVIMQAMELIAEAGQLDKKLVTFENCSFDTIQSNVAVLHANFQWPESGINIGNATWKYEDTAIDVPAIAQAIEYERSQLVQLEHQLKFTVRRNNDSFSLDLEQPLRVHGKVEIGGSLVTDDLYVRRLEEEPFTIRNPRQTEDSLKELHVKDLKVRYLNFDNLNGVPATELVFNTGDKIELTNKLVIDQSLTADNIILPKGGTVNGVDLSESTIYFNCKNRRWPELHFEHLEVAENVAVQDTINGLKLDVKQFRSAIREASADKPDVLVTDNLVLDGSVYFETINGIPWMDFIQRIVLKNRPNRLRELRIDGSLILEHPNTTVYHLNELAFPSDYLLSSSPREAIVTGYKHFVNTTHINILDIDQTVNGIDLKEIVTLQDDQHIPGNVTFAELHVSERLEVEGAVRGKHIDEFLDNPTLLQTTLVKAACQFKRLHVDGPVIVKGSLNGGDELDAVLADVVYDTEHNVEIAATKRIQSAEFLGKVTLESRMINEFRLDEFVTRSTEQEFDVSEIVGDVFFQDLTVGGLFDGINVTQLDLNSIKLFGDQYTEASLVFKNPPDAPFPDIDVRELRVEKTLNSKARSQYLDIEQEEIVLTGDIVVNHLDVKHLELVRSPLDGPSKTIGNVHLPTFDDLRFSLTRPQQILAPFLIDKLFVNGQLLTTSINGHDLRSLKADLEKLDNFKNHLLMGHIPIENLYIGGDLQVNMLNDVNFDGLLQEVIWLDRTNRIPGTVHFLDPLIVKENLTVRGLVNDVVFNEFLSDLVLKTDEVAEFYAPKVFVNGLVVEGNVTTESINNILVSDLALKNQTVYLRGDVEIVGDVYVNHLLVDESLNGEPMRNLLDRYRYDSARDVHVVKGDLYFQHAAIKTLNVQGSLNQIPDVDAFLTSLIRKDQDYNFTKPMEFKNEVIFEKGVTIGTLNGADISNVQNEIVRINDPNPVELYAEVVFKDEVRVEYLKVQGDLIAPNVNGINPDSWLKKGIMTNQNAEIFAKVVFEPGTFIAEHINAQFLNGLPTADIITLTTPQTIKAPVFLNEITITQPMDVGGLINGVNFMYERQNTLMTYGNQHIRVPTIFNSVRVLNSLTLPPIINGRPFGKPVLLGPQMTIESPISFRKLRVKSLVTEDMLSGVDFDAWYHNSLWTAGREHQLIEGPVIARNVRFGADVEGNGKINGVDIKEVIQRMKAAKQNVEDQLLDYRAELRSMCSTAKKLVGSSQKQVYYFKYFVQRQVINGGEAIESFHFFDHLGYHFLAINVGCESQFYQWDPVGRVFVPMFKFYTGVVEEWQTVVNGDRGVYLVTRSSSEITKCKILGVGVWLFSAVQLRLVWNAAEPELVQAIGSDPSKPDSFYVLKGGKMYEYTVDGNVVEQWNLPMSETGYKFVPNDVGLGLAVSDGKMLVVLTSVNRSSTARPKRSPDELIQMALFSSQSMYDRIASKNLTSEQVGAAFPAQWETTEVIEADDLQQMPHPDRLINDTLVHVNVGDDPPVRSLQDEVSLPEATIAREIPLGGIFTAENLNFPEYSRGEMIAFRAGPHDRKRNLVAVSTVVDSVIHGNNDVIKIFVDIQTGLLYQVLHCHRPSQLTSLELRDETILVFLEDRRSVQVYIYRGMLGFVKLTSFHLAAPVVQMRAVSLPQPSLLKCRSHYLAIATAGHELVFLKAKTQGDCGLEVDVDCTLD